LKQLSISFAPCQKGGPSGFEMSSFMSIQSTRASRAIIISHLD
jgi:hypothetical protein